MGFIEKLFLSEIVDGETPETAVAKMIRFILHGKLHLPVANVADLSSLTEEELRETQQVLSEVGSENILKMASFLHMKEMLCAIPIEETVPFLLAQIAKTERTQVLQHAITLLSSPESFRNFVKFSAEIKNFEMDHTFRCFISEWYGKRDNKTIADLIAKSPDTEWSHRRIMTMGNQYHSVPLKVMYEYSLDGYDQLNFKFLFEPKAFPIIDYFSKIEDIRRTTHSTSACNKIHLYNHVLSNINDVLQNDKDVNKALVKTMEVRLLLGRLLTYRKEDFFRDNIYWDMQFVLNVCYRLTCPEDIRSSNISPSESLIALEMYLNGIAIENEFATDNGLPLILQPPFSNKVVDALDILIEKSFMNIPDIEVNFRIFINCYLLSGNFCGPEDCTSAHKAAAVLALSLKKAGRNVTIFTSEKSKIVEMTENTVSSLGEAIKSRSAIDSSKFSKNFSLNGASVIIGLSNDFYSVLGEKNISSTVVCCNLSEAKIAKVKDAKNALITVGFSEKTFNIVSTFLALSYVG